VTEPVILITGGEPAGIGPDLCVALAAHDIPAKLCVVADPQTLYDRAATLGVPLTLLETDPATTPRHTRQRLCVWPEKLMVPARAGVLDERNAACVLAGINRASDACQRQQAAAMVTLPVQKSLLDRPGLAFRGHTEYLAARLGCAHPLMLLVANTLRIALATTHIPLREVATAITTPHLLTTLQVLHNGLRTRFGLSAPRIGVLGLNPHAGENGHLGREEIDIIEPAIAQARALGLNVLGPWPADTAFTPHSLAQVDAQLAMYHDQGLPVLKHSGFEQGVNITLGLPIVRTSVDHGTALSLAGTGQAKLGSCLAAIDLAIRCSRSP
jgi:4-hydroxythreonine-4-phosphate dehydrogenase